MESKRPRTRLQHHQVLIRKCREKKEKEKSSKNGSIGFNDRINERGVERNYEEITETYGLDASSDVNTVRNESVGKKNSDGFTEIGMRNKHKFSAKKSDCMSDDDLEVIDLRDDVESSEDGSFDDSETRAYSKDLGRNNKIKHINQMRKSNSFKKNVELGLRKQQKFSAGTSNNQNIQSEKNARNNDLCVIYQLRDEEESSEEYLDDFETRTNSKKLREKDKTKHSSQMRKANNGLKKDKMPLKRSVIPNGVDQLNDEKSESRVGYSRLSSKNKVNTSTSVKESCDDSETRINSERETYMTKLDQMRKGSSSLKRDKTSLEKCSFGNRGVRLGGNDEKHAYRVPHLGSSRKDGVNAKNRKESSKNVTRISIDESDDNDDVKILEEVSTLNSVCSGSRKEHWTSVVLDFDISQKKEKEKFNLPEWKRGKGSISNGVNGKWMGDSIKGKKVEKTVPYTESSEESEGMSEDSSETGNFSDSTYKEERASSSSDDVAVSSDKRFVVSSGSSSVGEDERDEGNKNNSKIPLKQVSAKRKHVGSSSPAKGKRKDRKVVEERSKVGESSSILLGSGSTKKVKAKSENDTMGTYSCPFILGDDDVNKNYEEEFSSEDEKVPPKVGQKVEDVPNPKDNEEEHKEGTKAEKPEKNVRNAPLSVNQSLVNSIWEKGSTQLDKLFTPREDPPDEIELLPLKFEVFSDSDEDTEIPEKSEWALEGEELFKEFDYVMEFLDMGNSDSSNLMNPEENYPSNTNKDHSGCCLNGGSHSLILDEQIGLKCTVCNFVVQEIRNVMPEFAKSQGGRGGERFYNRADFSNINMVNIEDFTYTNFANFEPTITPEGTVWDLIPGVINSMYPHQREGFEFIWKNISGSIFIDKAKECISNGGGSGCIMSHAPGTGKTRLTSTFIQSYMQLNPDCRPLIIVPCNLLHTWEQEFKKWNVGIPFHNLNSLKYSGLESAKAAKYKKQNKETVRLVKLLSWMSEKSVIGISYDLFEKLAYKNEDKKNKEVNDNEVAEQIRKMLLVLPGLLVLDESHIPRNQDSQILKTLLELKTERRIMLSGTPFQNTFEELLNTLCLARPLFADQILAQDNGNYTENNRRNIKNAVRGIWASMTNTIGKDDNQKLSELKEMINGFVHVYKGSILEEKLPGLNEYVVVLSPTNLQRNIIEIMKTRKNSFNIDHLRSIISVHPSLVLSVTLSEKEKLSIRKDELEKLRRNPNEGVKTKFIINLVALSSALDERVLIFAQFIDSMKLVMEHLSDHFKWTQGREILYMSGDHNDKQRQSSISLLNDPKSEAKVLLASTKACSEGINLIGASRVVLLDINWNPSTTKQAISRAYRLGQEKVVYVYHLIDEIWEGAKYMKQAEKVRISELVFSSKDSGDKGESSCSVGEDKILQDLILHPNLKSIFSKILYQPKDQDLFDAFSKC